MKAEIAKEQRDRLERLAAAPEADIGTSDIPEVRDWSGAIRGASAKAPQEGGTVSLDADVLAWFKDHSEAGRGYQSEINRVLRRHVAAEQRRRA